MDSLSLDGNTEDSEAAYKAIAASGVDVAALTSPTHQSKVCFLYATLK
jgi:hypothetical protein